jgi:hypothetical protein
MTENGNELVMPVQPMGGGYGYGGGMGGFGYGSDFWLILILLFAFGGGWGGFGGFGGMGGFAADGAMLYPWMNQAEITTNGFQNQGLNSAISSLQNSVTSGFGDVQLGLAGINQNICQSTAGVTQAMANGFAQAEIANNGRQIANMQTAFANQTAMNQGFNGVQSQLAQCCCDNRLASCQTQNAIQNEGNATRFADANNTRDIITNQTQNTQAILDKLCALELDGVKAQLAQAERENVGLQNQLNMATLRESQTAQNAFISQGFANEVDQLYSRLSSCPVPSTPVFGRTPIFTCGNNGCGCGGATF